MNKNGISYLKEINNVSDSEIFSQKFTLYVYKEKREVLNYILTALGSDRI